MENVICQRPSRPGPTPTPKEMQKKPAPILKPLDIFEQDDEGETANNVPQPKKNILSNLNSIIQTAPSSTAEADDSEKPWFQLNLVIKCMNGELGDGKYSGQLGVVQRLIEGGFGGEIRMVDSLDVIALDQDDCRPTLPSLGAAVKIVAGSYAGGRGVFEAMGPTGKDVVVQVEEPKSLRGRTLALPLSDVCNFLP